MSDWCAVCRRTTSGRDYTGTVNTTSSGKQCQNWSSNTTHVSDSSFVTDDNFPDDSVEAAENYCRNPDPDHLEGVWCYTMDPGVEWEQCDIPLCSYDTEFETPLFGLYTVNLKCNWSQFWLSHGQWRSGLALIFRSLAIELVWCTELSPTELISRHRQRTYPAVALNYQAADHLIHHVFFCRLHSLPNHLVSYNAPS